MRSNQYSKMPSTKDSAAGGRSLSANDHHEEPSTYTSMAHEIEPQPDSLSDGGDSGYDEDLLSTASLASSMFNYHKEHGRTYHAEHAIDYQYAFPNDEGEQERLDIQYHGMRLSINNKMYHAPLARDPEAILDIGTGTGIWCMDVADAFPAAGVIGVDISPIQPAWVPPNLHFEVFDAEQPWTFADDRFSLVHTRIMNGFSLRDWPGFYEKAFKTLKPGGWVENQEFDLFVQSDDGTIPANSVFQRWLRYFQEGLEKGGLTARCFPDVIERQMRHAGFVNTRVLPFKGPIGPWPKDKTLREAGIYNMVAMLEGLHGLSARVFQGILGWRSDEMEVFLASVRAELRKKSIHCYWPVYIFIGQKPES